MLIRFTMSTPKCGAVHGIDDPEACGANEALNMHSKSVTTLSIRLPMRALQKKTNNHAPVRGERA